MAWYYGVYSCGHEGRVDIIGPGKDREWKKERAFSKLCPECYKKYLEEKREEENKEAAKLSAEMELTDLYGTPKQIAWANTLRINFIDKFSKLMDSLGSQRRRISLYDDAGTVIWISREILTDMEDWILNNKLEARFWIDFRDNDLIRYIEIAFHGLEEERNAIPEDIKEEIDQINAALTISPENKQKEGIVEITETNGSIKALYIKDNDFIDIVKSLGYRWTGIWEKSITEYTGSATDRAAELGNTLLANGFTVRFPDSDSKDKAISGDFEKECSYWVKYNLDHKQLSFTWKGHDNIYDKVMKLPSAKYRSGSVLVSLEFYKEVLDFADTMGFKISKRALEEIKRYKEQESKFDKVSVKAPENNSPSGEEKLRSVLKKSGVIEDLKDDFE